MKQETNTNYLESNENKGHETTDSIQLQKQRSQSSNKCVNQNDKSETLLHNNRAIYYDRNVKHLVHSIQFLSAIGLRHIGHLIKVLGFLSSFPVDFSFLFISFLS
jgi:hypothetical protein